MGLKRSFWVLAAAMNVPNVLYLLAAVAPVLQNVPTLAAFMFFDQFGYGFGFAGYLICLQAIAQRHPEFTTAHYAIGTGLGGFLIALAGTLAGTLLATLDFWAIFIIVLFFAIPCLLTIRLIPDAETEGIQVRDTDLAD
jgi:PAT family beta-lactamase induction signal transducer AmpG